MTYEEGRHDKGNDDTLDLQGMHEIMLGVCSDVERRYARFMLIHELLFPLSVASRPSFPTLNLSPSLSLSGSKYKVVSRAVGYPQTQRRHLLP